MKLSSSVGVALWVVLCPSRSVGQCVPEVAYGGIVQDNWHFETPAVDVYGKNIGNFGERSICLVLAGFFVLDLMFRCLCNDGQLCGCAMVVAERRS